ncbi:MAG TPA: CPBP family intramembrane glutamic endopeptidase [Anaerolineales bacterium]|nr:CPBP family intramembrane glutamic endopeptidase [Anaerolineales bacterium]
MNETLEKKDENKNQWVLLGMGYILLILIIGGYLNYTQPYHPESAVAPILWPILLWTSLYIPLLVFPTFAKWELREFGFSINPAMIVISLFLSGFCAYMMQSTTTTWYGALSEAFARTGEEIFFRGFLFLLLVKTFANKRRPWLWAIIGSSLAFMLVHTQIFQASVIAELGPDPVALVVAQRLFNLFLGGVAFAALRHWTKSILPSSIAHSAGNGGIGTLPFVLVIYVLITYWAYRRKENIVSGFEQGSKVTV